LHRNEEGDLLAIATWESKELRDAAMTKLKADPKAKELMGLDKQYGDWEFLGNFEEIANVKLNK
jgi:uncharacterized protein YbaA (DUF1428 family)